jgi:hypothetical protein
MTIKDLQLYKEDGQYYLSAVFNYEDKKGYYEMSVPKINLPISYCQISHEHSYDILFGDVHDVKVDFGFCTLNAHPFDDKGTFFTVTCLEEKVQEMTLDEIEKELGYKIKLKEN